MADRPTRILILGGGFGGVYTALTLEKLLKHEIRDRRVELGLISRDNYIVFQPMLPEVISGSIGILDTITPIRRLCPSTNLYTRTVDKIDLDRKRVSAAAGFGSRQCALEYDHLVIALGNVTSFAGQPGLAEHALPFKYLGDALALRNRIIHTLEEADIERDPEVYKALLTVVRAGGEEGEGPDHRRPAPRAARPSGCLGHGGLRVGHRREDRRALSADRPARDARSQVRRAEHRGGDPGRGEARVLVHGPRQDGLTRPPLGSRRDLRHQALRVPRVVALAYDLSDEAPGPRPQDPRRDRLDTRPDPAHRHHPAQDRQAGGDPPRVLRAERDHLPPGRPRRLALRARGRRGGGREECPGARRGDASKAPRWRVLRRDRPRQRPAPLGDRAEPHERQRAGIGPRRLPGPLLESAAAPRVL